MGDPAATSSRSTTPGGFVLHTVGSAEEARRAVASGVDVVVAQGWEAGGHVWGQVATLPLVPAVVDAVAPVPVIAAGGIGDARGVAAVFALGAQAAWLGTRFLLAEEMPIHDDYRRRLIAAAETDGDTHRGWASHRQAETGYPAMLLARLARARRQLRERPRFRRPRSPAAVPPHPPRRALRAASRPDPARARRLPNLVPRRHQLLPRLPAAPLQRCRPCAERLP